MIRKAYSLLFLSSRTRIVPDSAFHLASIAAKLLSNESSEACRRAGAKVLTNLAVLGKPLHPSDMSTPSSLDVAAGGKAHGGGAAEALRHAILLAPVAGSSRVAGGSNRDSSKGIVAREVGAEGGAVPGGAGIGDWARQTLAPLLSRSVAAEENSSDQKQSKVRSARDKEPKSSGAPPDAASAAAASATRTSRDLWAALAVAAALVQAARFPAGTAEGIDSVASHCSSHGPRSLLSAFLLETPLASGLLALARRSPLPAAGHASDDSSIDDATRSRGAPPVNIMVDDVADAAVAIAKETARLCPMGVWSGLRAELLPALTGSCPPPTENSAGDRVNTASGRAGGGGRGALVLREVVDGMGTGVVPFASRLLPVALRGMTDADEEVR